MIARALIHAIATILLLTATFGGGAGATAQPPSTTQAAQPVFRVTVLQGLSLEQAQNLRRLMESWGYLPVTVENQGAGRYRVLYGEFPTEAEATAERQRLEREGVQTTGIAQGTAGAAAVAEPGGERLYTAVAREFNQRPEAEQLRSRLASQGYEDVAVRRDGRWFQVTVGNYSTLNAATQSLARLHREGYQTARVQELRVAPAVPEPAAPAPAPAATPQPSAPAATLAPVITQSEIWQSLTDDQRRQVLTSVQMQQALRQGDTLAQQVLDISERLENLDERVRSEIDRIKQQETADEETRNRIISLNTEQENLTRAQQFQEAAMRLRQIQELDPTNRFGWNAWARQRIAALESLGQGERYPGQATDLEERYNRMRREAETLAASSDYSTLMRALGLWQEIKLLDPARYSDTADAQIAELEKRLKALDEQRASSFANQPNNQMVLYALAGAVVVIFVLLLVVWSRGRKRHQELMRKVQEITTIRPMRELGAGAGPAMLGSGEPEIFAPRQPRGGAAAEPPVSDVVDPLGGVADTPPPAAPVADRPKKKMFGRKAQPEPEPPAAKPAEDDLDALFGGGMMGAAAAGGAAASTPPPRPQPAPEPESPQPHAMNDEFNMDSIFGGPSAEADTRASEPLAPAVEPTVASPRPAPPSAEPAAEPAAEDDPFAGLFADIGNEPTQAQPPPPPSETRAPAPTAPAPDQHGDSTAELLAMFDQVAGGSVEPLPEPVPGHSAEPAAAAEPENEESPFDALLGDLPQISLEPETVRDLSTSGEAETAVPSAPLDDQSPNSPFNFDLDLTAPENERTSVGSDLPTAAIGAAAARSGEAPGTPQLALDFEDEPVGQAPANWQGDYDYAELLVADDTPARGSQQYLRFDKREGSGKAHYHTTFPAVTGRVGIEFDLRCNDKNKFLLGFYVEKNGDFQQAIHTKILRSEAQSTPTIHMQGEAAPYLLGSWVHIKYIVDLDAGTLNGMIDSTHVVRDMPLQPNPGMLNTLSIRDNINTTGVLLIDNIRIYPIQ